MKVRLAVVIPCHNEEENIKSLALGLFSNYRKHINEMILVNDGSTDNTKEIIEKMAQKNPRIKIVNRRPPNGVGLAIRDGLKNVSSQSTHVLTMDADFVENIKDIKYFLKKIDKYDGLVGSRYLKPNSLIRYPFVKRVANRGFHYCCKIFLGIDQKDLTNNYKFYKKQIFDVIPLSADHFSINAETGIYPIAYGFKIGEIPVKWVGRTLEMGVSKFALFNVGPKYFKVLVKSMLIKYFNIIPHQLSHSRK